MYHIFFILSSAVDHLDWFCYLALVNSIAINSNTQDCLSHVSMEFFAKNPGEVELDHMIALFSNKKCFINFFRISYKIF